MTVSCSRHENRREGRRGYDSIQERRPKAPEPLSGLMPSNMFLKSLMGLALFLSITSYKWICSCSSWSTCYGSDKKNLWRREREDKKSFYYHHSYLLNLHENPTLKSIILLPPIHGLGFSIHFLEVNVNYDFPHDEINTSHSTTHIPTISVLLPNFYTLTYKHSSALLLLLFLRGLCILFFSMSSSKKSDTSPTTVPPLSVPTINRAFVTKLLS